MFFAPCFRSESEITIWGPASPEASLEDRIARYISAPLSPVEVRELPCDVSFLDTPASEWEIGPATIRAESVTHRGPTLGYRITDGDTSLAYIPDHEPGLGAPLETLEPEWISGYDLARRRRPADPRLPVHRRGVPRPRRLGPLPAQRHPHLRPPGRGPQAAALPPRPAPLRRVPRPLLRHRRRALGGAGRQAGLHRDGRRAPASSRSCRRAGRRRGLAGLRRRSACGRPRAARTRAGPPARAASPRRCGGATSCTASGRPSELSRGRDRGGGLAGVVPGDRVGVPAALAQDRAQRRPVPASGRSRPPGPARHRRQQQVGALAGIVEDRG